MHQECGCMPMTFFLFTVAPLVLGEEFSTMEFSAIEFYLVCLSENVYNILLLRLVWSVVLLERLLTDFLLGHGNLCSFCHRMPSFLTMWIDGKQWNGRPFAWLVLSFVFYVFFQKKKNFVFVFIFCFWLRLLPLVIDLVAVSCVLLVLTLVLAIPAPGAEVMEVDDGHLVWVFILYVPDAGWAAV